MELYDDRYYIEKIKKGNTECFACLVDKYSRQVFTLIVRIVRNREDAEELTQDVFMKTFRTLSSFKGESSFSTWLYRIAYNTAISATRKKQYEYLSIEDDAFTNLSEDAVSEALGRSSNEEQLALLDRAMELLPPDDRALILLFYLKEKTVENVASITGLSESNVKTKLHRIRKKLYVLLSQMEDK